MNAGLERSEGLSRLQVDAPARWRSARLDPDPFSYETGSRFSCRNPAHGYIKTLCDYLHLNPVRAGILTPEQALQTHRLSKCPLA